jgi:hypothetical protein
MEISAILTYALVAAVAGGAWTCWRLLRLHADRFAGGDEVLLED